MSDSYTPLQVYYADDPWRVLVVCLMLNLTSRRQVGPVLDGFFDRWPSPERLCNGDPREIARYLEKLGLGEQRTDRLIRMSRDFIDVDMRLGSTDEFQRGEILSMHGCGEYAADAYEIFCLGNIELEPTDRVLRDYVVEKRLEDHARRGFRRDPSGGGTDGGGPT